MREMIKRKPKFKVGDKVKHIWSDNATTVAEITKKGYRMESGDEFVDFDDEDFWESVKECELPLERKKEIQDKMNEELFQESNEEVFDSVMKRLGVVEPIFKVGDRVKRKVVDPHNPATEFVYTVTEIDDDIYHKYCLDHNDHESWIPISAQDELELVNEPEPKLKLGVDLNKELRIDSLWKDMLANFVGDITKRNTDAFGWFIDETLKFMDCGAYDEMACKGMRLSAKELKKRLGINE